MPEKSLLELLPSRGLRYRREDSFKLVSSRLLADRFLIAVRVAGVAPQTFGEMAGMLRRLRALYGVQADPPSCGAALHLVQLAARRNAAPIYLEVGEEGTARRSYDINLYKANLTLAEIEPVLLEAAARYALPQERFAAFYSQLRQHPFGHLSGGFARDGSDFLTVYYETQPL